MRSLLAANSAFENAASLVTSIEPDPSFRIGNGSVYVRQRAHTPAALVMLGNSELSPRGAQMLESRLHMRLVGPGRSQPHGSNSGDENDTNF